MAYGSRTKGSSGGGGGGGELIIVFSFSPIKYDQELWNTGKYISLHIVRYIDKYSLK